MQLLELSLAAALVANFCLLVLILTMLLRKKSVAAAATSAEPKISSEEALQLTREAEEAYRKAVGEGVARFGAGLDQTSEHLNQLITKITTQVVEDELQQYHTSLEAARTNAVKVLSGIETALNQKQQAFESELDSELAKRQQFLVERLDKRLGVTAVSYIVEALGQGADLGAQKAYILESLERHKEDLKQDLNDAA